MNKLSHIDAVLSKRNSSPLGLSRKKISNIIFNEIRPKDSITVDEIEKISSLTGINWDEIEWAVMDLIDEDKVYVANGVSKKKIGNNIGRIFRH
jgi:hypothetical protein